MAKRIVVINPNSNEEVTRAMDEALDIIRSPDGPLVECVTLHDGPFGVETNRDSEAAAPLVSAYIEQNEAAADSFVIACYSDPGLRSSREITNKPVFGIAETGLASGLMLGGALGVISILPRAVERHWAYARSLGLDHRIVADLPVNLTVAELANEAVVTSKMCAVGKELRETFGATVIVLGCAGMARYRAVLEHELGCPVIDPTQAAVAAAISVVQLEYRIASSDAKVRVKQAS